MNQSTSIKQMSQLQYAHMNNSWYELANIFRTKGILTEEDMNNLNIPSIDDLGTNTARNQRPKDQRPLSNQRSVIMNSVECVLRYNSYIQDRQLTVERRLQHQANARIKKAAKDAFTLKSIKYNEWINLLDDGAKTVERREWKSYGGKNKRIELLNPEFLDQQLFLLRVPSEENPAL